MKFFKRYWYLILLTIFTIGIGGVAYYTSTQLTKTTPVAPNVAQVKPQASETTNCVLAFKLAPTPTGPANQIPTCTGLSVDPASGNKPLTVTLKCSGTDPDGDINAATFNFGDSTADKIVNADFPGPTKDISTSYVFSTAGTYTATCKVRDNSLAFSAIPDACKQTITVKTSDVVVVEPTNPPIALGPTNTPKPTLEVTPTTAQTPKIPVSGSGPSILGISAIGFGAILLLLGLAL